MCIRDSFMAGQIAGLVNKRQPAAEIVRELFDEAEQLIKNFEQIRGIHLG